MNLPDEIPAPGIAIVFRIIAGITGLISALVVISTATDTGDTGVFVGFTGIGTALFIAGFGAIISRLHKIEARLKIENQFSYDRANPPVAERAAASC